MSKLSDTSGKISVWVGTTNKSFDEFNAYYDGLEDPASGYGIHQDFDTTFIDTDLFCTYGTADFAVVPIEELCTEIGCNSLRTEQAIVQRCRSMGITSGNVLSYYCHTTFSDPDPTKRYNDMRFVGSFDDD